MRTNLGVFIRGIQYYQIVDVNLAVSFAKLVAERKDNKDSTPIEIKGQTFNPLDIKHLTMTLTTDYTPHDEISLVKPDDLVDPMPKDKQRVLRWYECSKCHEQAIVENSKRCSNCGRTVKWELEEN